MKKPLLVAILVVVIVVGLVLVITQLGLGVSGLRSNPKPNLVDLVKCDQCGWSDTAFPQSTFDGLEKDPQTEKRKCPSCGKFGISVVEGVPGSEK